MTLDALELDRDAFLEFIKTSKPSYTQLEKWILDQKGGSLDVAKVDAHNKAVIGYNHDEETRKAILSAVGIADTGAILDAINLNNLDDWQEFYNQNIA